VPGGQRLTQRVTDSTIYLVPIGSGRFELYAEPPDEDDSSVDADGMWRRVVHWVHTRWRDVVQEARHTDRDAGLFTRARDAIVRRTADALVEQRIFWTLRHTERAELVHPSDITPASSSAIRDRILDRARAHHIRWLVVDGVILIASSVFALVPGPNVIAYYFAFRVVGHYFSWRGSRRALHATTWRLRSEAALVELGRLAELPHDVRAVRLDAIASDLNLPRLAAFFNRAAA
jgi:K+-H+ exchange-related protein